MTALTGNIRRAGGPAAPMRAALAAVLALALGALAGVLCVSLLGPALEEIARFDICREHGIIVAESALETALPALAPPYTLYREYRYGKIKLTVYHRGGNEETI